MSRLSARFSVLPRTRSRRLAALVGCAVLTSSCSPPEEARRGLTMFEVFQLRSECARLGRAYEEGLSPVGEALFRQVATRYDAQANRCRVEVAVRSADLSTDPSVIHRSINDGQTRALLAFANLDHGKRTFVAIGHPDVVDYEAATKHMDDLMDDR